MVFSKFARKASQHHSITATFAARREQWMQLNGATFSGLLNESTWGFFAILLIEALLFLSPGELD
jgi:hypothetical protein